VVPLADSYRVSGVRINGESLADALGRLRATRVSDDLVDWEMDLEVADMPRRLPRSGTVEATLAGDRELFGVFDESTATPGNETALIELRGHGWITRTASAAGRRSPSA
jgi:hypothetical protein